MYKVFLLLGSNLPFKDCAPARILKEAGSMVVEALLPRGVKSGTSAKNCSNIEVKFSSIEETEPLGKFYTTPKKFVNQVIMCPTNLLPEEVLRRCLEVETFWGRTREEEKSRESGAMVFSNKIVRGGEFLETEKNETEGKGDDKIKGRERIYHNRTIDIDILRIFKWEENPRMLPPSYEWKEITINTLNLCVPHPRLQEREFARRLIAEVM